MGRVSVVSLTLNKLPVTRRCFMSLLNSDEPEWEFVIVDNGSTDGTREWLHEFVALASAKGVSVKLVFNDSNVGCSTARNQGVEASSGEYVVFVDNDIALRSRGWLGQMIDVLDASADGGMVGPKLVYPFGQHRIQCAGAAVTLSFRRPHETKAQSCGVRIGTYESDGEGTSDSGPGQVPRDA